MIRRLLVFSALVMLPIGVASSASADPGGVPRYNSCGVGKIFSSELRSGTYSDFYGVTSAPGASEIVQMPPVGVCAGKK